MDVVLTVIVAVLAVVVLVAAAGVRFVLQYERGVVLRFGRLLPKVRDPGLQLIMPLADQMTKVLVQTVVLDVPSQGAITRDNVTISVDAVVYFRVKDPVKAVVNVQDYRHAVSQVAQTSLRSVIGRADLDTVLSDREKVNAELRAVIDTPTEDWGVAVDRVEVKDVSLPEAMRRSMSRQAEAERDRRARIINADGEYQASARLADAARMMGETPGALQLRLLQTLSSVAAERNNTLVMPFPVELLRFADSAAGSGVAGPPAARSEQAEQPEERPDPEALSAAPAAEHEPEVRSEGERED
ncbi:MAG: slipin family protein [Pseudonocardiaceae bacterium]|nr:slipin family protein [Pseudonocardiaceae bacterium]